ncbi:hypothetical protein A3F66_01985 [candidate division TM6 bacterium RIFCSPHIGHO2_12_FULL_32_22]|nr:MAG: hypothetical protein A3F66_01985 [candidate division TM6 bacterium RIFCSPHIGHO2_12_FULL_32_22]
MLKNIFLPNSINNYYIFGQRIIGLDLRKNRIIATQIFVSGKKSKIEKVETEIVNLEQNNYDENLVNALKNIFSRLDKANQIRSALPNSLTIFKDLKLPFIDYNKIAAVLPFEIESSIPFKLYDAVVDFVVTGQDKKSKKSEIIAAVTQKKHTEYLDKLFSDAQKNLNELSVDILSAYCLLKSNNIFGKEKIVLLDLSYASTAILVVENGSVTKIRTVPKGFRGIIHDVSESKKVSLNEAWQQLERSGHNDYEKEINLYTKNLSNDILFTLASLGNFKADKFLIMHSDLNLDISKELYENLKTDVTYFDSNSVVKNNITKKLGVQLENNYLTSVSIAIPNDIDYNFNLLSYKIDKSEKKLILEQLITTVVLSIFVIGSLFLLTFLRTSNLKNEYIKSNNELISVIKKNFDISDPTILKNSTTLINNVKTKVDESESLWFSFSKKTRFSFIKYLQELSTIINAQDIGLKLSKLNLSEGSIVMAGSVPSFTSLTELEESLNKSDLFSNITVPQETEFTITLTLKKNDEEV